MPPRAPHERCRHHRGLCAFRDDDPAYCPFCHRTWFVIVGCDCGRCGERAAHLALHEREAEKREIDNERLRQAKAARGSQSHDKRSGGRSGIPLTPEKFDALTLPLSGETAS